MTAGLFISWTRHHGRSVALAAAVGVDAVFVATGRQTSVVTAPWRWTAQAMRTIALLVRRRPRILFVMAPPLPLVLLALCYAKLRGACLVVDAHTGALLRLRRGGSVNTTFLRVARHADLTIVTTENLATLVRERGGMAVVLHDPLVSVAASSEDLEADGGASSHSILFPCSWSADEPLRELAAAVAMVPEITVLVTGEIRGVDREITWPPNARLTGWLSDAEYRAELDRSDAVLALTTREETMQQAGYEALIVGKPLVASDTRALREYFSAGAVFASAEAGSLADAMRECMSRRDALRAQMRELRAVKLVESAAGVAAVRQAVGLPT